MNEAVHVDMHERMSDLRPVVPIGSRVFEDGRSWRVIRWCEGREAYVVLGCAPDGSWGVRDQRAGRGFWAVPLAWDGSEDGAMRFFPR